MRQKISDMKQANEYESKKEQFQTTKASKQEEEEEEEKIKAIINWELKS